MVPAQGRVLSEPLASLLSEVGRICAHDLSLLDRAFQVERVLLALGWDMADPHEATRMESNPAKCVFIRLNLAGSASLVIAVQEIIAQTRPPRSASKLFDTEWTLTTNGVHWVVWRRDAIHNPVETISLTEADAEESLKGYASKGAHAAGGISRAIRLRRLSRLFEGGLARLLDRHPNLESILNLRLAEGGTGEHEIFDIVDDLRAAWKDPIPGRGNPLPRASAPWLSNNCPGGDVVWPNEATHMLKRKGCVSYISCVRGRRSVDLLPGSVMRRGYGASFPAYHSKLRESAIVRGSLIPDNDYLRVFTTIELDTPSTAAIFVAGSVENGLAAWRDRNGKPIGAASADRPVVTKTSVEGGRKTQSTGS